MAMGKLAPLAILLVVTGTFAIQPAAQRISRDKPFVGAPLFDYEKQHIADDALLWMSEEDRKLVAFDNSAVNSNATLQPKGYCKVFPGDADWPSDDTWGRLNGLLGGALIPTVPLAAPCYQNWGVYDKEKCAVIAGNRTDPFLHEADPTSNMWPIFQGRTCVERDSPNGTCTLGAFPVYAVKISTVSQIQLALNFARNHNIRLVIKNTGHCYLGKSLGAGGLSIWTHNLKNIDFIEHYKSDSGYEGKVLKVGAGVTVKEVYKAAHKYGVTALGGICESVGYAGGYIAGGGHTPMSGYYGMAADNVEALEVVLANGRFVTASNTSNPDLYWALRGGGGSTFGIVTSVLIRVHPKIPIVASKFRFETGGNVTKEVFWQGMRKYFEMFIPFTDAHTYSYFFMWATPTSISFSMSPFFAPNHTIASFNALVKPWFDHLSSLGINVTPQTKLYDSFYPAYIDNWGADGVGGSTVLPGNRLFPRQNWEDPAKFEKTFAALKKHSIEGKSIIGYHQAPRNRMNVDNAVSSVWRHTIAFLISAAGVEGADDATSSQMQKASDTLTQDVLGPWREVAPESENGGAYLNEANVMEPNWQQSFYGNQYPRLLELKKKWDPKGLFYATTAVGSEDWGVMDGDSGIQTQNGKLCRV